MRCLIVLFALVMMIGAAHAQGPFVSSAQGYWTTTGCPAGTSPCYKFYDTTGAGIPTISTSSTRPISTPTVQNAAYSSGNCIGGFRSATVARINGGSFILNDVLVSSLSGQTPTVTVYLFDSNPASSTCTDKSTFTLADADVTKLIAAPFALTLAAPTGATASVGENANMARLAVAGGSTSSGVKTMYYALVSGSAFTPGSTTDISVALQVQPY